MYKIFTIKSLMFLLLCTLPLYSLNLIQKYPGYSYVLSTFEIDESYIDDQYFDSFVMKNELKIETQYRYAMKKGSSLIPLIKDKLMQNGLPDIFIYVAMVESAFSPNALSSKKAAGLWQFMPKTAEKYNLSVNGSYDERYDPVVATSAAMAHLQSLHEKFGKWYLAILAYNCGEGRLSRAIKIAKSDLLTVLLDDSAKYLPLETRNYMRKILLAAMIGENSMIDYKPSNSNKNSLIEVEVIAGTKLKDIAKIIGIEKEKLLSFNRHYKGGIVPKKKSHYTLLIPEDKMVTFYMNYVENKPSVEIKPYFVSYIVRLGDTLNSIAKRYKTTILKIKAANQIDENSLTVGAFLLIPISEKYFEDILKEE